MTDLWSMQPQQCLRLWSCSTASRWGSTLLGTWRGTLLITHTLLSYYWSLVHQRQRISSMERIDQGRRLMRIPESRCGRSGMGALLRLRRKLPRCSSSCKITLVVCIGDYPGNQHKRLRGKGCNLTLFVCRTTADISVTQDNRLAWLCERLLLPRA